MRVLRKLWRFIFYGERETIRVRELKNAPLRKLVYARAMAEMEKDLRSEKDLRLEQEWKSGSASGER